MARGIITGTTFRNRELDITSLKDLSVQERASREEAAPPNLYEQLSAQHGYLKGELHHALPAHRTLLRVFDFPSDDEEEIEGMVDLQMEKIAPFPVEHMYVSHEVLHEADGISRVLVVAAHKKWVEHAGESFAEAGLDLTRIDVDILGWLHLLRNANELPEHGRHLVMLMDESGTELVLLDDGVPLGFRSLGVMDEDETEAEFMGDLVEELEFSLTSLEAEWGGDPFQSLTVWHRGAEPYAIDRLGITAGVPVQIRPLASSSIGPLSEGVALRAASAEKSGRLDLAPSEWVDRIRDKGARRGLYMAALAMVTLFLLYLLGVILFTRWQDQQLETAVAKASALEKPAEEVVEMQGNVRFLEGFTDRDQSSLETLKRITDAQPAGIDVTDYRFVKKDLEVQVKGTTKNDDLVNQWTSNLDDSGRFAIDNDRISKKRSTRGNYTIFDFRANLVDDQEEADDGGKSDDTNESEKDGGQA